MAAILVLMGVIRQDWGSHKIQGATKERAQGAALGAGGCRHQEQEPTKHD